MFLLRKGQSLIEVLVAVAVGAILIIGGVGLVAPTLQTRQIVGRVQQTASLGSELVNNIKVYSEMDWHHLLTLATDTSSSYYLNTLYSPFRIAPGTEQLRASSGTYSRYFTLADVYRDAVGNVTTTAVGNTYDPSTKQVTVTLLPPSAPPALPLSFASSSWIATTALPQSPNNSSNGWTNLVSINNCLYAMGGYPGSGFSPTTTIYYATLTGTGKVGTWSKTTPIPQSTGFNGLVNAVASPGAGYVYILGSGDSGTATSSVFYAKTNADCTLSSWQTTTPLPGVFNAGTLFINNGYIYNVSGFNNNGSVEYAKINADGTLGAWTTQAAAPPTSRSITWSSGVAYGGYFYIPGGADDLNAPTTTVFYTAPDPSGAITSWQKTTPLPVALRGTAVALNGYLYVLGGDAASHKTSYYAPINADGSVGAWTQGSDLPSTNYPLFDFDLAGNAIISVQPNTAIVKTTVGAPPTQGAIQFLTYVTRNSNASYDQTDWSGGPGQGTPVINPTNAFATSSLSPAPPTTIHVAQTAIGYEAAAPSASTTFASAPSGGDLIVAAVAVYNDSIASISDTAGNAYSQIKVVSQGVAGLTLRLYLYYAMNVATSSPFTITASTAAGRGEATIIALDVNAAATSSVFDQSASALGTGTTANSGAVTTASAGELYVGVSTDSVTAGEAPGTGYTEVAAQPDNNNFQDLYVETRVSPTATTTSATFTSSNGSSMQWNMILGTFKTASVPGSAKTAILWSNPGYLELNL